VAFAVGRDQGLVHRVGSTNKSKSSVHPCDRRKLSTKGSVSTTGKTVQFTRPGLVEEYSVSMEGVRQDFVITARPAGAGDLTLWLDVNGAEVHSAPSGITLRPKNSRRTIAYNRLRVIDANGMELGASMEAFSAEYDRINSKSSAKARKLAKNHTIAEEPSITQCSDSGETAPMIAVFVNDRDATYPVRVDPTFSDANWVSMGGIAGANGTVRAAATDGSGNLYIGGDFSLAGSVYASRIAKWDGISWSALQNALIRRLRINNVREVVIGNHGRNKIHLFW
jgi:hypothetical protein